MSDIINILPEYVSNQIAAGEVIDRPASAVKELLENAVDAGATDIQLIVKDAGRTLIQVTDNGCGMSETDACRCFERHATSKIKKTNDLYNLHTMGFRGEALASIAAVSQVVLHTRLHDAELGTAIELSDSGEIQSRQPCTCNEGTSFMVKNLFCSVPARRHFLKKDSIELSHIEEIFRRVALVYTHVTFSFYSNGHLLYNLKAGNLAQRIVSLFGEAYRQRLFPVDEESDVVKVHGYICKPEYARRMRGEQYLFVNDRFIKHASLSSAVEKAYSDLIPDHSFPSYFLQLTVDPSRLDVNIHPTKTEVRFVDEHAIFAILRAAAKRTLGQFSLGDAIAFDTDPEFDIPLPTKDTQIKQPTLRLNPNYNPFAKKAPTPPLSPATPVQATPQTGEPHMAAGAEPKALGTECPATAPPQADTAIDLSRDYSYRLATPAPRPSATSGLAPNRSLWEGDGSPVSPATSAEKLPAQSTIGAAPASLATPAVQAELAALSRPDAAGNAFDMMKENLAALAGGHNDLLLFNGQYVISTLSSGLLIVDVRKAQERIIFDRLMRRVQGQARGGGQQLLFPVTCTFSVADAEILKELVPELQKMGFELNPIGITGFVVTATPADVDYNELQELLFRMIAEFKSTTPTDARDQNQKLCLALARQQSARTNVATMKAMEMQSLLAALFSCQMPTTSPSGKRTLIVIKPEELAEKMR